MEIESVLVTCRLYDAANRELVTLRYFPVGKLLSAVLDLFPDVVSLRFVRGDGFAYSCSREQYLKDLQDLRNAVAGNDPCLDLFDETFK